MPRRPVIQDRAVIARNPLGTPVGEALRKNDPEPHIPMSGHERVAMTQRLELSINFLMNDADNVYRANCCKPGTTDVDPDYISRLSTNEFFFYTKEPLTLKEFEELQNKIAIKAENLSPGIQLILGSFAIKTDDNKVMNVTPHITCGQTPTFNFIVKNYTSPIDVRYKNPDGSILPVLNIDTHKPPLPMPKISVNKVSSDFSFNNLVPCKTPGGTPFITAVDICLDHYYGVAKANAEARGIQHQPISHVVVSNYIDLVKTNCLSPAPMHVDPHNSPKECKQGVRQIENAMCKLSFGNDYCSIYLLEKCLILTKQDELELATITNELHKSYKANVNIVLTALSSLENKVNAPYILTNGVTNGLTIAEQAVIIAYFSKNPAILVAVHKTGMFIDVQKIANTCCHPLLPPQVNAQGIEKAGQWISQELVKIDQQLKQQKIDIATQDNRQAISSFFKQTIKSQMKEIDNTVEKNEETSQSTLPLFKS